MNCEKYNPTKKYVQINDLVIDNFDMLESAQIAGGFKTSSTAYTFGHGSYSPSKARQNFLTEQNLSLRLNLNYKKLSRENKKYYKDWVKMNLLKPGKIYAVEGNQLLFAFMNVTSFSEEYQMFKDMISIDVDITLHEGTWHIADKKKIFLEPYDLCNFSECLDFKDIDECVDCCISCKTVDRETCNGCMCDCDYLNEENSLCFMKNEAIENFYKQCVETYRIIYNCQVGKEIFGDKINGIKICKPDVCNTMIAGQFYSNTIVDSDLVTITLTGEWENPTIEINGNKMQIRGKYSGTLKLYPDGTIMYRADDCCDFNEIAFSNLKIIDNFGYLVHHGTNQIFIDGSCCKMGCVFIKVDELTF